MVDGMPDAGADDVLLRELIGLPAVITATPRPNAKPRVYDLQLAGSGAEGDLVAAGVLKPLNAKLGQPCFSLGPHRRRGSQRDLRQELRDPSVLARLETNPPAGLYGAPPPRQKALIKNPETLQPADDVGPARTDTLDGSQRYWTKAASIRRSARRSPAITPTSCTKSNPPSPPTTSSSSA